jgi:hypothetical protein
MMARGRVGSFNGIWGPFITPALIGDDGFFQTPTADVDIDGIFCGFTADWSGSNARQLRTRRVADAVVVAGNEQLSSFIDDDIGSGWRQFEVSFLLDDLVPGEEDFRIMMRQNLGPNASVPGSAGWSSWEQVGEYDYTTEIIGAGIDISSGFYVGYGFFVASTSTSWQETFGSNNQVELDDIRVVNYTVIPP